MPAALRPALQVRPGADRPVTATPGVRSWHSFAFGAHRDQGNTHFGLLVAHNEDRIAPGGGFPRHQHRDMEILTWVLAGELTHRDAGGEARVRAAGVQRITAGTGISHDESNETAEPAHAVQMWVLPGEPGLAAGSERRQFDLSGGELVPVASGLDRHAGTGAVRLGQPLAALHVGRLGPAGTSALPVAPYVHLFIGRGEVELEGAGDLRAGDAARITACDGRRLRARTGAEVLVWEMFATIAGALPAR